MKLSTIKAKSFHRSWYWFVGLYLGSLLVIGLCMAFLRVIVYALTLL
jgi:hypothetical protein